MNQPFEFSEQFDYEAETQGLFGEAEEIAFAAELLEVGDEAELDQFLDRVILEGEKRGRKGRKRGGEPQEPGADGGEQAPKKKKRRKGLGGKLKKLAKGVLKKGLPIAGKLLGSAFGGPLGGAIGGQLGSAAGGLFGKELYEGESEEQELEAARRLVRLAGEAGKNLAAIPMSAEPNAAIQAALNAAARKHAPEVLGAGGATPSIGRSSGRWVRIGRRIIVMGAA